MGAILKTLWQDGADFKNGSAHVRAELAVPAGTVTYALPVVVLSLLNFRFDNESRFKALLANCVAYLEIMHL